MTFPHGVDGHRFAIAPIAGEIARPTLAEFWRELARPVTFFDEASLVDFLASHIAGFFRKSAPGRT